MLCFPFLADLSCPNKTQVLNSSTLEVIPDGENITSSCNNDYWRATPGEEAEIIIDMKCSKQLETFSIMNGYGDFGTKKFSLFGSREVSGPWTELYRGELPQGLEMTKEVTFQNHNIR